MNRPRFGFTMLETVLALGLLGMALILVSQLALQSLDERRRSVERLSAIEHCNNVLETARALPWSQLTPEWAREQRLPAELVEWMIDPVLTVRVEQSEPRLKHVAVELKWRHSHGVDARSAALTALFADRAGGKEP